MGDKHLVYQHEEVRRQRPCQGIRENQPASTNQGYLDARATFRKSLDGKVTQAPLRMALSRLPPDAPRCFTSCSTYVFGAGHRAVAESFFDWISKFATIGWSHCDRHCGICCKSSARLHRSFRVVILV